MQVVVEKTSSHRLSANDDGVAFETLDGEVVINIGYEFLPDFIEALRAAGQVSERLRLGLDDYR